MRLNSARLMLNHALGWYPSVANNASAGITSDNDRKNEGGRVQPSASASPGGASAAPRLCCDGLVR